MVRTFLYVQIFHYFNTLLYCFKEISDNESGTANIDYVGWSGGFGSGFDCGFDYMVCARDL